MKTLPWILALLLTLQASPQERSAASLDGVVVSFGTDIPIAKADVELRKVNEAGGTTAPQQPVLGLVFAGALSQASPIFTTSADGKFSFRNIAPGNYRLYVTRGNGYIPGEYGQRSPVGTGTPLTLAAGQSLQNVRLSMAPTASISGRIVDGDGDPIAYARVQALRVAYEDGQRVLISVRGGATDDRGEYRIYSLPPGEYYVASRPPDSRATRNFGASAIVRFGGGQGADAPVVTLRATDSGVVEETWRAIFYPGSFDARTAQVIPLRIGQNLRGVDINLGGSATPALHVRGTVVDTTTGLPATGAIIRLLPRHQLTPSVIMPSASTDASGRFDVGGVLSGSYAVVVTGATAISGPAPPLGLQRAAGLSGYAVIDVGNTNVEGLQIALSPGIDIPFTITMPGVTFDPSLIKNLRITINRKPVITGAPVGGGTVTAGWPGLPALFQTPEAMPADNGGYLLRGVALGDFTVEIAGLPPDGYVKSVSVGRNDVLVEGLQLMRPLQNPMEIVLASDSGTVSGRVLDTRLQPAGNVTAVLVPDPARRYRVDLFQSVATDGQGAFRFANVAPGEYKIFAWEDVISGAWHDADFLRSRESLGALVRIAPGRNQPVGRQSHSVEPGPMKIFLRGCILLLLAASSIPATQAPPASIEGIVIDLIAGNPLPKVTLDLQASGNPGVRYPGITSPDGRFVFRGVLPGRYSLTAMRTGYVRSQYGQRGPNGVAATLTVAAGQAVTNVQLSMVRSGAISGRITDVDGEAVAEAQVHAWKVAFRDGWRVFEPIVSLASNDLGEFRLFGLPPGQYYISAQPEPPDYIRAPSFAALGPTMPGAVVTSFSAGQGGAGLGDPATQPRRITRDWSPVYFGGTTDPFAATSINLPPGNEIRNADIVIDRIPMVPLSGITVDASGAPVRTARITVTPVAPGLSFVAASVVNVFGGRIALADAPFINSGANGDFRGRTFPRGMYLLTAIAGNQGSRISGQAIADLRGAADTNFIRITLAPSRELAGQVVVEGRRDGSADLSRVRVGLRSTAAAAMDIAPQSVSSNGTFVLRDIPAGDYLFNISTDLDKSYVRSVRAGSLDLLEDGLRGNGFAEGAVRIVIALNAAELRGSAVDESGAPMSNVTVVLLPDESHRSRIDLYRSTTTDAAGVYRFDRVPPGTYKLFAWEDVEKDAWRNPAFMSLYESRGQTLQINEDGSTTANVNVLRLR